LEDSSESNFGARGDDCENIFLEFNMDSLQSIYIRSGHELIQFRLFFGIPPNDTLKNERIRERLFDKDRDMK
jgi:hypothetical protein